MRRHRSPDDVVRARQSVISAFRAWSAGVGLSDTVVDGDTIELAGRTLDVRHRPRPLAHPHRLLDPARRMALAADHLLPRISSNPLATPHRTAVANAPAR